jgi:putative RNA 2'-phosphotransferase
MVDRDVRDRWTELSKFLSYVLRHRPESIGLSLGDGGWVPVETLLSLAAEAGRRITREDLEVILQRKGKQRFALSEDGARIRASQGHSVAVDLQLSPLEPPELLYHGTIARSLPAIRVEGLRPMGRQHVHLSVDRDTARTVGGRRGPPVVLEIAAGAMHRAGHLFYRADNGVWLTAHVPPSHIAGHS